MVETDFYVPDEKLDRFAVNYVPTPEGGMMVVDDPETSAYRQPPKVEMGGSGLVATAGDYLRFARRHGADPVAAHRHLSAPPDDGGADVPGDRGVGAAGAEDD